VDKLSHRSHIRVVVVDGAIGYTGGFGLDDKWLGNGLNGGWRETNVRFLGPAVAQLQATFAAGWAEATGELLTGDVFFPRHEFVSSDGSRVATAFHAAPTVGSTPAERFLAASIAGARETLYLTAPYFVPDDDFRGLLTGAAKRGVDVRILTAGEKIDVPMTRYAGRAKFEELLDGGVRIFEYTPSMVHAKTFVIDGVWCSVGTMNFDNRSMAFNDETNLVAYDAPMGGAMNAMFLADLRHARELTREEFRRRPWTDRLKEWMAVTMSRVL
jgi:cardiolipin synthase